MKLSEMLKLFLANKGYDMEKIKRQIISYTVIIIVMLITGFCINQLIKHFLIKDYQIYDTAAKITKKDLFKYGIETNIGYAFVFGDAKTLDPVSDPELPGKYSYIQKIEQVYTHHFPKLTKENMKNPEEINEYWSWDIKKTEVKKATKISFLDVEFDYGKIPFPAHKVQIVETSYNTRNIYYTTDAEFQGTIFTNLNGNTINDTTFYVNQTIKEVINDLKMGIETFVFGLLWLVLTIRIIMWYYKKQNRKTTD